MNISSSNEVQGHREMTTCFLPLLIYTPFWVGLPASLRPCRSCQAPASLWIVNSCSGKRPCGLELRKEYFGDKLSEEDLRRYGFKGGQSKRRPLYNKPEMFAYIETVFNDSTHVKVCGDKVEEQIRSGQSFGYGGEGDSHKELKEYIFNNPNVIGIEEYSR